MRRFPHRSPGVIVSPVGDRWIVFDLMTETLHHLNASAGAVLLACDGTATIADLVAKLSAATGAAVATVSAGVDAALSEFRTLGLVGRTEEWTTPPAPTGCTEPAPPAAITGVAHQVIDTRIAFRSTNPEVLAAIDGFVALDVDPNSAELADPLVLDVGADTSSGLVLSTDFTRHFPDIDALLADISMVTNEYATWAHTCITLHAGAVRSPAGQVVLLPAPSGSGKSTLTAALVMAGWDYLSDEAVGVRADTLVAVGYPKRLSLDLTSRTVLGLPPDVGDEVAPADLRSDARRLIGDVAPISRVLLPCHVPGASASFERLTPEDAAVELLANSFNLARMGQEGLETICALAESVTVERLVFDDVQTAVGLIRTSEHTTP